MQKIEIAPFQLIGIEIRTTNENNKAAEAIPKLWQRFMSEDIANKIPNKVSDDIYSLYTEYESDYTKPYTTVLGCRVNSLEEIPDGMVGKSFKGGTYLKSTAKGDLMKGVVIEHWKKIWEMDLKRLYTADFEIYGAKAHNPSEAEVEFYLAVKE